MPLKNFEAHNDYIDQIHLKFDDDDVVFTEYLIEF